MIDRALCIRKSTLRDILIILVWFTPYFMYAYIPSGRDVFVIFRLFVNLMLVYNTSVYRKMRQPWLWFAIGYILCSAYGMIFVSGITFGQLVRYGEFATFFFAIFGLLSCDTSRRFNFLTTVQNMGVVYSILNLIIPGSKTVSGYGGEYFFLGAEASAVQLIAMLLIVSTYVDFNSKKKVYIKSIIIAGTGFLFAMQNESGQGRVMIAVFVILLFLNKLSAEKLQKIMNPIFCVIGFVAINIITITLRFQTWDIASYVIQDLLHKDMTLTGREYIFTQSISIFLEHPILGYGYESSIIEDRLSGVFMGFNSAHNSFLQILINTGLIGAAIIFIIVFLSMSTLKRNKDEKNVCIYFGIIALFAGGIVNLVLLTSYFWFLIAFALSERSMKVQITEE